MADENGSNGASAGGPADAKEIEIQIVTQYVRDLSFESPNIERLLQGPAENPNLNLEINVNARRLRDNIFQSEIEFKANARTTDVVIYEMEAVYGGVFRIENMPNDTLEPFLLINCPSILFPFLRRLVADLTREGGFPPLFLDPIDFGALYMRRRQQTQVSASNDDVPET